MIFQEKNRCRYNKIKNLKFPQGYSNKIKCNSDIYVHFKNGAFSLVCEHIPKPNTI